MPNHCSNAVWKFWFFWIDQGVFWGYWDRSISKLLHLVSSSTPQLIADDIMCQWQMNIYNLVRPNLEEHIWLCKKYDYQVTWNYN